MVEQGEIVTVRDEKYPLLVISNNAYNKSGHLIACPILPEDTGSVFSVYVETDRVNGYVLCDNPRNFNWYKRGYFSKGSISLSKLLLILDINQSFFELLSVL